MCFCIVTYAGPFLSFVLGQKSLSLLIWTCLSRSISLSNYGRTVHWEGTTLFFQVCITFCVTYEKYDGWSAKLQELRVPMSNVQPMVYSSNILQLLPHVKLINNEWKYANDTESLIRLESGAKSGWTSDLWKIQLLSEVLKWTVHRPGIVWTHYPAQSYLPTNTVKTPSNSKYAISSDESWREDVEENPNNQSRKRTIGPLTARLVHLYGHAQFVVHVWGWCKVWVLIYPCVLCFWMLKAI